MACYLCGSTSSKKRDGKVRDNDNLDILECNECGLVFLSSTEHISEGYYEDSNMSRDLDIQTWKNETYTDDTRRFEFVKEFIINKDIIDFGSGIGGFLLQAKTVTKSVCGIELDTKVKDFYSEQNIPLITNIDDLEDENYDIITAFHVIEHLQNPIDIINQLLKKLRKGGKIIIEVPNANDALLTLYKSKAFSEFTYWSPHIFLYTHYTLNLLFRQLNTKIHVDFIKNIQRYPLSNHLYWLANSQPGGHQKWGSFIDSSALTKAYEEQLASLNATDTLITQITKI